MNIPKSRITNNGIFKKITFVAIEKDGYSEFAKVNIIMKDKDAKMLIDSKTETKLVQSPNSRTYLGMELNGEKKAKNYVIILDLPTRVIMDSDGEIVINKWAENSWEKKVSISGSAFTVLADKTAKSVTVK